MADNKSFRLQIISPDRVFYEGDVDMLELRTTEGVLGILKGHIPLTAVLSPGMLKIEADNSEKIAAVHDGFVEIIKDKVIVLAEACEWPEEIDVNRAKEAKIRAERRLQESNTGEMNAVRAEMALRRSLIRLELAEKGLK